MGIAEIKQRCKERLTSATTMGEVEEITIGVSEFVFKTKHLTLITQKEDRLWEFHMVVTVNYISIHSGKRKLEGEILEAYKIIMDYWKEYAAAKSEKGLIVRTLYRWYRQLVLAEGMTDIELEALESVYKASVINREHSAEDFVILGGSLSEKLQVNIKQFLTVRSYFEGLLEDNCLLKPYLPGADLSKIFTYWFAFKYVGEKFYVTIENVEEGEVPLLRVQGSDREIKIISIDDFPKYLKEVEQNQALQNAIEPPTDNFRSVLAQIPGKGFDSYNELNQGLENSFDELCGVIGDWKRVEKEVAKLKKQKLTPYVEWEDKLNRREVEGWKNETNDYVFYFLMFREMGSTKEIETRLHVTAHKKEEGNEKVSELITEYMITNLRKESEVL